MRTGFRLHPDRQTRLPRRDSRGARNRGENKMSGRENNIGLIESASRRSFLGAGSAAIAAAAFGAFAANGQEREDTQMGQQVSGWAHILDGKVAVVTGAARGIGR